MPELLLGPMLRHVGRDDATVWVQTDAPCRVEVLGHEAPTFTVAGHHYAIVTVRGLQPGVAVPYRVALDGRAAWPPADSRFPPPVIRPVAAGAPVRLAFGSCRTSLPHRPPYVQSADGRERGHGIDALRALAERMASGSPDGWPDHLLMLGDQIYADELSPRMREVTAEREGAQSGASDELCDFGEYALAYAEAWGDPLFRWLFSVLPTSMIFDDHEIHAEWKISAAWLEEKRREGWYDRRIAGGLAAYWVYQHLGNLSPDELECSDVLAALHDARDGIGVLHELAVRADREGAHSRWSFCRDIGRSRLVAIDSRAGREVGDGARRMVDPREWAWIADRADGDYDHLLLASSVPFFLVRGLHELERWNEAVCDGAWGRRWARLGERVRRGAVLDHWAAFGRSFAELVELLGHLATGGRSGRPPRSIVLLSGDVHHCYLARVALPDTGAGAAPVWQAVCSPYRKQLDLTDRLAMRFGASRAGALIGRALRRAAGLARDDVGWQVVEPPSYDNQVGTLEISAQSASLRVETTVGSTWREPGLQTRFEHRLV